MSTKNFVVKNGLTVGSANIDAATGNINGGNANLGNLSTANFYTGNGYLLTGLTAGNISGQVANALVAGTVYTNAQPNITSVGTLTSLTVSGTTNLGNVANVTITGGTSGYYLQTNGSGGLSWAAVPSGNGIANGTSNITIPTSGGNVVIYVGNNNTANFTSTGANINGTLKVTGISNLGPNGNVVITGGNANQILQTDGAGNLAWVDPTGGYYLHTQVSTSATWTVNHNLNRQYVTVEPIDSSGNSYTGRYDFPAITYNNANSLTLTFSSAVAGWAAVVGGGILNGNVTGGYTPAGVNTQVQFNDNGTMAGSAGLVYDKTTGTLTATVFAGSGASLTNLPGANVTGTVTSATNASAVLQNTSSATTVYPTFTTSGSNGNSQAVFNTSISANLGNASITATTFVGALSGAATTAGTVTTAAQPNITSVGTLSSLGVSGSVTASTLVSNVSTGTAPLTVTSTTKVTNLNADLLDGYNTDTAATASTVVVRDANGNVSANFFIGNGSQLTGIGTASGIANGNSNISIPAANGNVNITAVGNTVLVVTGTGANITGTANVTGNANVGNLGTATAVITTGNITTINSGLLQNGTSNVTLASGGNVSTFIGGNATAQFVVTSTGANIAGTANVVGNLSAGNVSATNGNFTTANATTGNITTINSGLLQNGTSNVTLASGGNVSTFIGGNATAQLVVTSTGANIAGTANVVGNLSAGNVSATNGNFTTANVTTAIATTGNITTINSGLMQNGNSNITIAANGNISHFVTGNATSQLTVAATGANIAGYANVVGNITAGNVSATNGNFTTANATTGNFTTINSGLMQNGTSNVTIASGGNVSVGSAGNASILVVTGTGANITGTANVTGNANVGNLGTSGVLIATGNITSSANLISDNILGRTGALTITSAGTNTNINLKPNGTGNIDANSTNITSVKDPVNAQDAATKNYVDQFATTGLAFHTAVTAATTGTLATATGGTMTYNNGASGVGANLVTTGSFNLIDTANVQTVGTRILVKNEANAAWNGVYTWANATTIVRATDADSYGPDSTTDLSINDYFFVSGGQTNKNTAWVVNGPSGTITFGTSDITFSQFSSIQAYTANTGLTLNPDNSFSISNTAVTAASYGNGDRIASFTVNGQGQLTAASNVVNAPNAANLTGTTLASGVTTSSLTTVGTLGSLSVTGNASAANFVGALANGTSNVAIPAVNGNVNITAGGATTLVVTSTGANITGTLNTGTGNANVGNLGTATAIITTGNITTINSGLLQNGTSNVTLASGGNVSTFIGGNATAQFVVTSTGANIAGTANVVGNANVGNLGTATAIITTGNITTINSGLLQNGTSNVTLASGGNVSTFIGGNATAQLVVTSTGANIAGTANVVGNLSAGNVSATNGNFTTANATTGNITTINSGLMQNGNSNITIASNGNISHFVTGNATSQLTVAATGANIAGYANVVGNITAGNVSATNGNFTTANVSGQLISTQATGTAPLAVNSTTRVANLNVANAGFADAATNAAAVQTNASTATTVYPTFVSASTNANYALNTVSGITANLANNAISATTFVGNLVGNISGNSSVTSFTANTITVTGTASGNANVSTVTANLGLRIVSSTYTDNVAAAGTVANAAIHAIGTPTLVASNAITTTNLSTFYIQGAPTASTNVTATNSFAMFVGAGNVYFGGNANIVGNANTGNIGAATGVFSTAANTGLVQNGTSNVTIASGGNISSFIGGNSTAQFVVAGTGVNVAGYANIVGNANIGNIGTATAIITTGNITTINSGLMQNGTSNVTIASGGNVSTFIGGNATAQFVVTSTGANIAGTANVVGNANVGNLGATNVVGTGTVISNNHTVSGAASGNSNVSTVTGNLGLRTIASTYTDNVAAAGTVANAAIHALGIPTLVASNAITTTNLSTFYIAGAPTASTNVTATNSYALFVAAGNAYFNANVTVGNIIGNGQALTGINGANVSTVTSSTNAAAVLIQTSTNTTVYLTGTYNSANANNALEKVTGIYANMGNNAITATQFVGTHVGNVIANVANGTVIANMVTASGAASGNSNVSTVTGNLGIRALASTYTDNVAAAGTVANAAIHALGIPTLAASNAITTTNLSTFYIAGAPTASTNVTATNSYALFVAAGNAYFASNVTVGNIIGNGQALTGLAGANVTGQVANANVAYFVNTTASTNSGTYYPLIANAATGNLAHFSNTALTFAPSTGTLSATVLGGNLSTAAQPNITSVGTLTSLTTSGNITVGGNLVIQNGVVSNRTNVSVSGTATAIDQFAPATWRTAKYVISGSGDNGYESVEALVVHDGTNAYITIYAAICSNTSADLLDITANINGISGNVTVYASSTSANCLVNVISNYIKT